MTPCFPCVNLNSRSAEERLDDDTPSSELGISVAEVIVALLLLGLGTLGASATFVTSTKATTHAKYRSQAMDLAVSETERIRTLPYDSVGIVAGSPGFVSTYRGRTTAPSAGSSPETGGVHPSADVAMEDRTFTVTRHITWNPILVNGAAIPEGYKIINIVVAWNDSAGAHSIEHQSGLYEGIGA